MKQQTKKQVYDCLIKYPSLKDDDNRLCANIWAQELTALGYGKGDSEIFDFLRLYATNKITTGPTIKRVRAKLQEEFPALRGEKYKLRKGILKDKWLNKLGYTSPLNQDTGKDA